MFLFFVSVKNQNPVYTMTIAIVIDRHFHDVFFCFYNLGITGFWSYNKKRISISRSAPFGTILSNPYFYSRHCYYRFHRHSGE